MRCSHWFSVFRWVQICHPSCSTLMASTPSPVTSTRSGPCCTSLPQAVRRSIRNRWKRLCSRFWKLRRRRYHRRLQRRRSACTVIAHQPLPRIRTVTPSREPCRIWCRAAWRRTQHGASRGLKSGTMRGGTRRHGDWEWRELRHCLVDFACRTYPSPISLCFAACSWADPTRPRRMASLRRMALSLCVSASRARLTSCA